VLASEDELGTGARHGRLDERQRDESDLMPAKMREHRG
jgi:hypothetical protein